MITLRIQEPMNLLKDSRVYLCGGMENCPDNGVQWRARLKPFLRSLGIKIFDPTEKPINIGSEKLEDRNYHQLLRRHLDYEAMAEVSKIIRGVDLRMIDIVDFLVVNIDTDISTCGTWEELFLANSQKKPILVYIKQGKHQAPFWLFGTIPHRNIFGSWDETENYIRQIDNGYITDDRFYLFNHSRT